jgi:hypothetical protein
MFFSPSQNSSGTVSPANNDQIIIIPGNFEIKKTESGYYLMPENNGGCVTDYCP